MKTPFDPKLRLAAKEFEELCKKYDVMGSCIFASKTHAEFFFHIEPTWSVARLEKHEGGVSGIRFRAKKEDFPSKEVQQEAVRCTVHGITTFLQYGEMLQKQMGVVLAQLRTKMKVFYEVWGKPNTEGL